MEESRHDFEKEFEKEIEKRVEEGVTKWVTILVQIAVAFVISVIVFKFVWAWVVPDLFPGAVAQGLVSENLSWLAALKLAVLVGVLSGFYDTIIQSAKGQV
jgi:hypothetical protein